ncbi:MAG: N-acyl amino acid synthase FeeM domain-containing protein [Candidatus Zhuqueibacterota bacterium]
MAKITVVKILNSETRKKAFEVIEQVYLQEKNWIYSVQNEIPEDVATNERYSWFLASVNGKPAGVLRLYYDPPLEFPADFKVTLHRDVDLKAFAATCRFVEIGRFMILREYRKKILVALRLMRIAIREVVQRDYTHFITDVFENEPNSPLQFHTRVLGFEVIGTHLHGELNCSLTRIILTLDILKAYQRLRERNNRIYWSLTRGIRGALNKKLAAQVKPV